MKIAVHPYLLSSCVVSSHSLDACSSLILADDMGVGKTIQILGLIMMLKSLSLSSSSSSDQHKRSSSARSREIIHAIKKLRSSPSSIATDSTIPRHSVEVNSRTRGKRKDKHHQSKNGYGSRGDAGDGNGYKCICGSRLDLKCRRKQSLDLVQCDACDHYHHAYCAGFKSYDEVIHAEHYICLACKCLHHFKHPLRCRTTLIVMPNTLISQWINEIHKHMKGSGGCKEEGVDGFPLRVLIYPEDNSTSSKVDLKAYDPHLLCTYDVIILSFKALQHGYHQSNVDYYNSSRVRNSIYTIYPPAFLCLEYRLVVLDETQHIESKVESQSLRMACRIPAISRICVSGTPLGSGRLSDLYSLCKFLRIEPFYSNKSAWKYLIEAPIIDVSSHDRLQCLVAMFATLMLRRTKAMIRDQLELHGGSTIIRELRFSSFEVS